MTNTETQPPWIPGNKPEIPEGSSARFWVTLRSKKTGKTWATPLSYLNAHVMQLSNDCDPPDCAVPILDDDGDETEDYAWTGWSGGQCAVCETEWMFDEPSVEIVAFAPAPKPYAP